MNPLRFICGPFLLILIACQILLLPAQSQNPRIPALFLASSTAGSSTSIAEGEYGCWTTISLSTSGSPSHIIDDVTFTANVNSRWYCHGEWASCDDGEVLFYDHKQLMAMKPVRNCQAQFDTYSLAVGKHHIRAAYNPESRWHASAARLIQVVELWATTIMLTSTPNPSNYKQDVVITATVVPDPLAPDTPTGKIKFFNGTRALRIVKLDENGVATLETNDLPVGTNLITAKYQGDEYDAGGISPVLQQVVNP